MGMLRGLTRLREGPWDPLTHCSHAPTGPACTPGLDLRAPSW